MDVYYSILISFYKKLFLKQFLKKKKCESSVMSPFNAFPNSNNVFIMMF